MEGRLGYPSGTYLTESGPKCGASAKASDSCNSLYNKGKRDIRRLTPSVVDSRSHALFRVSCGPGAAYGGGLTRRGGRITSMRKSELLNEERIETLFDHLRAGPYQVEACELVGATKRLVRGS